MSKTISTLLCLTLATVASTGCGGRHYNLRMHPMGSVDFPSPDGMGHYPGDGGVVLLASRGGEKERDGYMSIICVAPPSQSAITVDSKQAGKVGAKAKAVEVDLEISAERGEDLERLFDQNERTLFVQTAMYRLCEAHANGMLDGLSWKDAYMIEAAAVRAEAEESDRAARMADATAKALSIRVDDRAPATRPAATISSSDTSRPSIATSPTRWAASATSRT